MSALSKLSWAVLAVLGGMEVVVLDAVPSPVHDDLTTMAYCTVGGLGVGLGVAFALGTAFATGRDGKHRRDDSVAAPNGIPPWADDDAWDGTFTPEAEAEIRKSTRTRAATQAPEPTRPAVTQVDMAPVAETRETVLDERSRRMAAAWATWDETTEQPAQPDDTQLMLFRDLAELHDDDTQEPWTPPVAPDAPWSETGLAFMRVEVCEAYDKRHAGARAADVTDWFGMAAERQNGQVAA